MSTVRRALLATILAAPFPVLAQGAAKKPAAEKASADPLRNLKKSRDDMKGITWYQAKNSPKFANSNGFYLYFGVTDGSGPGPLRLKMTYFAEDWLFVTKAWAKADDLKIELPQQTSIMGWERDNSGGHIWEWSDEAVTTPAQIIAIRAIAESKKVTVRFEGKKYYNDRTLSPQVLADLKEVITAYEGATGKPWR